MLTKEQNDFYLTKGLNAAVRAGACILEIFEDRKQELETGNIDESKPLRIADAKSNEILKLVLGETRIPIMSAEGRDLLYQERCNWDLFWMIDPLDGTKEFVKGNGEFTVNIALMYNNQPAIGIICVPYLHRIYFAIDGKGSYRICDLIPTPDFEADLDEIWRLAEPLPMQDHANKPIRIAVSRKHQTPETFQYIDQIKKEYPDAEVVIQGSSYKFCMLAEATVDAYVRTTSTYEWDTAAGELILRETGGEIRTLEGEKFTYNKLSLINPHFFCKNKFL